MSTGELQPMFELFFPTEPVARYMNRAEALVYYNRRGMRPGIVGNTLDGASGKALDRAGALYGVKRERVVWRGLRLPWYQSDETMRSRTWLAFQDKNYNPNDQMLHFYP